MKSCFVVERTYFTKDSWIIYAEKKWTKFELISDSFITSDSDFDVTGINLSNYIITDNISKPKKVLIAPKLMNEIESNKLLNAFKKNENSGIRDLGWKSLNKVTSIHGQFKSKKISITNLSFSCDTVELMANTLSINEFKKISEFGLTQDEYDIANEDCTNEYFGPTEIDFHLEADGEIIKGSNDLLNNLLKVEITNSKDKVKKQKSNNNQHMIVFEKYNKSTTYELEIKEDFDESKLTVELVNNFFGASSLPLITLKILYDGEEFADTDLGLTKYSDEYLLDNKGNRHGFNIKDEDEE